MAHRTYVVVLLLLAALAGCETQGAERAAQEEAEARPRAASAVEGAMCKEHGVLEALCTKCNPRLVPVFQAKGDWCKEHGFPESICPLCHPERGGKPAADVTSDGAPADGTKVKLRTRDTARLAGIVTEKAVERQGGGGIPVTARIVYDALKVAEINARAAGVVRRLHVDVGAEVEKGAPLAIIDSADVGADRSRLASALSRLKIAEENLRREEQLEKEGVSSRRSVLAAQQELDAARAERASFAASLAVVGASAGGSGGYTLTTPLAGVVTQRKATVGRLVGVEETLFEVVDVSSMWAELDVPETDLPAVALKQPVVLEVDGLKGRELKGEITYVAPAIDPATRTAKARVPLANPDGALRANMFGRARILAPSRAAVMVPRAAVQRARTVKLVFVRLAEDQFEARRVEIGATEGNLVEVTKGVRPGEEVATEGSFLLKTETLKESIGAGCCGEE
ncbi:RND transporter [Sorangium cellulosum]|uniref:RND transporter n=1 Tax=Sorangium cellulosum TaxID=56 RepID=A0A4P2QB55_SORCE|nr:efflux RND transporter periplasmic adaptor subunit [Sorangium cellulosum]AUX26924.1 RND transporter [Sorangium cellulosum]